MSIIRFERRTVEFTKNISVDGYRMPNGEFRVGLAGASISIGFAANWLNRILTEKRERTLKMLQGMGFKHLPISGIVSREERGDITVETISLQEYVILIAYLMECHKENLKRSR